MDIKELKRQRDELKAERDALVRERDELRSQVEELKQIIGVKENKNLPNFKWILLLLLFVLVVLNRR